ncbi:MAG: GntR family transcriptional regulator [Streptomyces sp.]|nr:GntR family transcriptional regulator [Streptomyces sp.]
MNYDLDRTRILWRQIAAVIAARIADGTYAMEDRLPSVADIAAEWDVATATAQKIVNKLRDARIVRSEHGLGVFIEDGGPEIARTEPFGPLPRPSA